MSSIHWLELDAARRVRHVGKEDQSVAAELEHCHIVLRRRDRAEQQSRAAQLAHESCPGTPLTVRHYRARDLENSRQAHGSGHVTHCSGSMSCRCSGLLHKTSMRAVDYNRDSQRARRAQESSGEDEGTARTRLIIRVGSTMLLASSLSSASHKAIDDATDATAEMCFVGLRAFFWRPARPTVTGIKAGTGSAV